MQGSCSYDALVEIFNSHRSTAWFYLSQHCQRFVVTLDEFCKTSPRRSGKVLDVGSHWQHQAVLWRLAGFDVTAVDPPGTFQVDSVRDTAAALDITFLKCANLEQTRELQTFLDDAFDVVLFTEIIEHITFNPVAFCAQIYRVLAPRQPHRRYHAKLRYRQGTCLVRLAFPAWHERRDYRGRGAWSPHLRPSLARLQTGGSVALLSTAFTGFRGVQDTPDAQLHALPGALEAACAGDPRADSDPASHPACRNRTAAQDSWNHGQARLAKPQTSVRRPAWRAGNSLRSVAPVR